MPIVWRYLIFSFLKVVIACVLAFISILLTMRLGEIAHFAALGAPVSYLLYFSIYQIPYILPIAIPLSCLIGSLLLIQQLSKTHELTALRACGFSFLDLLTPILLTAAFLSMANFWLASEISTHTHLQTNLLKNEVRSINPLFLLHNKHLMRLKGFYFETLGASHVGESAEDVLLAIPNKHYERLNLMIAKNLKAEAASFIAEGLTLVTGGSSGDEIDDYDQLLIENVGKSETHIQNFSNMLQKKVWTINNDYLQMPLLLARIAEQRDLLDEAQKKGEPRTTLKILRGHLNHSLSEISKRLSLSIAVFSFTLMGASFGINISRKKSFFTLYFAIALTIFYLISFFAAKGIDHSLWLNGVLYLAPHLVIIGSSILVLRRMSKGIEAWG